VNRRILGRTLLGIVVSTTAILLVAQSADIPAALARMAIVDLRLLAFPALVVAAQMWVRAWRWAILLSAAQPAQIPVRAALWPTAGGYLGNVVLPGRLGEVVRIVLISRGTPVTATAATASVLVERVVDLLALLAFATASYGAVGAIGWLPLLGMLALLLGFGLVLRISSWLAERVPASLPARVRDVLVRFLKALHGTGPVPIAQAWLISLLAWLMDAVTVYLCAVALGVTISPATAILLSAGAALGAALPAAAAAFGTYELGAVAIAALVGVPADDALRVALMSHVLGVVVILALGVVGIVATSIDPRRGTTVARERVEAPPDLGGEDRLGIAPNSTVIQR
jgi:uncharacterized protein (TIRG00374 family)